MIVEVQRGSQTREITDDLRIVRAVQSIESRSRDIQRALLKHDVPRLVDLDHAIVELITDERIATAQAHGAGRQRVR